MTSAFVDLTLQVFASRRDAICETDRPSLRRSVATFEKSRLADHGSWDWAVSTESPSTQIGRRLTEI